MRGESLCVSIVHAALPIGGSIQASRHIQTELQNCFAYWGVKAHIIYNACCSASWEMNPRGAKGHQILFGNPIPISYSDILFRNPIPKSYGEILLQTSLQDSGSGMGGTSESATCLAQNAHLTKRICPAQMQPLNPKSYSEIPFRNLQIENPIPKSYSEILFRQFLGFKQRHGKTLNISHLPGTKRRFYEKNLSPQTQPSIPRLYSQILFRNPILKAHVFLLNGDQLQEIFKLNYCLAYGGVKALIFHSACCSAYWGMNARFKKY